MNAFSCHTWAFNDLPLSSALGTIARLGFRYVDIGGGPHINTADAVRSTAATVAAIRADLTLFNLEVSDFYLMLPRISLADESLRRKDIDVFKSLLPFAAALGTPGITVSPGIAHPPEDSAAFMRAVDALKEMVEAADREGLNVSIEPHMDSMAQTPTAALNFVNAVRSLSLTIDWAQFLCANVPQEEIVKLLPNARHIQLRQAARAQLQTPFKRGRLNIPKTLAAIQKAQYDGVIGVEYMKGPGPHGLLEVSVIREIVTLRDALRDARDAAPA